MVASISVEVAQSDVTTVIVAAANELFLTQSDVTAVFNIPSESVEVAQSDIGYVASTLTDVQVSQSDVLVIYRGRVDNPNLRAWTFSLDGHDFYVLRLGDDLTLVYDIYSEQWVDWTSPMLNFWRANYGINWIGGELFGPTYGSNVVVGDDVFGLIWFLDPDQGYDENPNEESEEQRLYFERITMGQVAMKGREVMPCYAVWLTTDMGAPAYDGAGVTLLTSDDAGVTFDDHGLVTVTPGETNPELSWYSLGQIEAPGRLFRIIDDGAIARIDGLEMNDADSDDDG